VILFSYITNFAEEEKNLKRRSIMKNKVILTAALLSAACLTTTGIISYAKTSDFQNTDTVSGIAIEKQE